VAQEPLLSRLEPVAGRARGTVAPLKLEERLAPLEPQLADGPDAPELALLPVGQQTPEDG
jgi:hypothetical protein